MIEEVVPTFPVGSVVVLVVNGLSLESDEFDVLDSAFKWSSSGAELLIVENVVVPETDRLDVGNEIKAVETIE